MEIHDIRKLLQDLVEPELKQIQSTLLAADRAARVRDEVFNQAIANLERTFKEREAAIIASFTAQIIGLQASLEKSLKT